MHRKYAECSILYRTENEFDGKSYHQEGELGERNKEMNESRKNIRYYHSALFPEFK